MGLAAALHLTQRNHISCVVYEIRPEPITLGGAVAIPCNGLRLLDRLGLYESILTWAAQTPKITVYSSNGDILGAVDVSWGEQKTGYGGIRVKREDLQDVLLEATRKEQIPIHDAKQMVSIQEDDHGVTVTFSDGTMETADLLLGRDGIHSSVRTLYVDPQVVPEYLGLSTILSFLPTANISPSVLPMGVCMPPRLLMASYAVIPCDPTGNTLFRAFSHEVPIPEAGNTRDGWEKHNKKEVDGFKST